MTDQMRTFLLKAAVLAGFSIMALGAVQTADHFVGHDDPLVPAMISAVILGMWILLLRRLYPGRRKPRGSRGAPSA